MSAKPWDILKNDERASEETADSRLNICNKCPELIKLTTTCKKCGCFMAIKVHIEKATCPLGLW